MAVISARQGNTKGSAFYPARPLIRLSPRPAPIGFYRQTVTTAPLKTLNNPAIPKLTTRVRFPSPAPIKINNLDFRAHRFERPY
jgi:hypothetical protein